LATEPTSQRVYRAACPNCGAPVEFRSAASAFAVCSFCKSTIVREGDALRKTGQSAELFDDHSPLQLGAGGKYQGAGFTLVGRLQYRYNEGTWNEWHALFDNGRSGWLSEDNGRYVMAFDAPLSSTAPAAANLKVGTQEIINGQGFVVGSVTVAKLIAAQGELPRPPETQRGFVVSDLRSTRGEVGTLDYSDPKAPTWSVGRPVAISELAMSGLADSPEKSLQARSIECPSCGTSLEVTLSTTQSIVCKQCRAVVDVSQGVGGDLKHYAQENGMEPQLPLGRVGTLALTRGQALPWQVVGYVERCEVPDGSDSEQSFWREYLLYNRIEGFAFLVDAEDGWSWTAPIIGVPQKAGNSVTHEGVTYRKLYDYNGQITYVLGEFYWQLTRNQKTFNSDYVGTGKNSRKRLNREMTGSGDTQEIVWSAGETLNADEVVKAFRLAPDQLAALKRDASPNSTSPSMLAKIFIVLAIIIVILLMARCSRNDREECEAARQLYGDTSTEYQSCLSSSNSSHRTGGGSYGGFSSGGGHK
jgi:ribosomal protein L37AE/L43A